MKSEINQIILMLLVSLCGISCKSHNLSSEEEQSEIKEERYWHTLFSDTTFVIRENS